MTENNHINTFNAEDFLRYARGQMPVSERYALEKAALDDPFLAEALDGYLDANLSAQDNNILPQPLAELRNTFAQKAADKTEEKKAVVVSIFKQKWFQIAAAACLVLGGGWWLFGLQKNNEVSTNKNQQIAKVEPENKIDTKKDTAQNQVPATVSLDSASVVNAGNGNFKAKVKDNYSYTPNKEVSTQTSQDMATVADTTVALSNNTIEKNNWNVFSNETNAKPISGPSANNQKNTFNNKGYNNNEITFKKQTSFLFKGKIIDANGYALPYSSVMIPSENIGTYSDGEGNFNLIYSDSVLTIKAKSLGFETVNMNIFANAKTNKIVMNEDKILDKNLGYFKMEKSKATGRSIKTIVTMDSISNEYEASPGIGWNNYDLYLANNNRVVDIPTNNKLVELSFEVDKNGVAQNILVEKSQGKDLDEEAIRLVKEGPKWKAKIGDKKAKLVVRF